MRHLLSSPTTHHSPLSTFYRLRNPLTTGHWFPSNGGFQISPWSLSRLCCRIERDREHCLSPVETSSPFCLFNRRRWSWNLEFGFGFRFLGHTAIDLSGCARPESSSFSFQLPTWFSTLPLERAISRPFAHHRPCKLLTTAGCYEFPRMLGLKSNPLSFEQFLLFFVTLGCFSAQLWKDHPDCGVYQLGFEFGF